MEIVLNSLPDAPYPEGVWNEKVEATWAFIFGRYGGAAETTAANVPVN
jgi:hypothetical protein